MKLTREGNKDEADRINMIAGELTTGLYSAEDALKLAERVVPGGVKSVTKPKAKPKGTAPRTTRAVPTPTQLQTKLSRQYRRLLREGNEGKANQVNRISLELAQAKIDVPTALEFLAELEQPDLRPREFTNTQAAQDALDALRATNLKPADYLQVSELQGKLLRGEGITPAEVANVGYFSGATDWVGKRVADALPAAATRAVTNSVVSETDDLAPTVLDLYHVPPGKTPYDVPSLGGKLETEMVRFSTTPIDGGLTEMAKMRGWKTPQVGTAGQVQDKIDSGWIEIWRGVKANKGFRYDAMGSSPAGVVPPKTGEEVLAETRHDPEAGLGQGIYGNGLYFSVDERAAKVYAESPRGGAYTRAALKPDAKIIEYDELIRQQRAWQLEQARLGTTQALIWGFAADPGRWAAMRGYEVIRVPAGRSDGAKVTIDGKRRELNAEQYVILNREVMMMEEGDRKP